MVYFIVSTINKICVLYIFLFFFVYEFHYTYVSSAFLHCFTFAIHESLYMVPNIAYYVLVDLIMYF